MKKYYAIQSIDVYKEGDEVPESKGSVWITMYKVPPVKVVDVPDVVIDPLDLNKDGKVDVTDLVVANKIVSAVKKSVKKLKK